MLTVVVVLTLVPWSAEAGIRVELAAETPVFGTNIEPFDFPAGVSGRLLAESRIRGETWFMAGIGYGALWSDEQAIAFQPQGGDRSASSTTGDPLQHWDLFMGPCWGSRDVPSFSFSEFVVGATEARVVGWHEGETDSAGLGSTGGRA